MKSPHHSPRSVFRAAALFIPLLAASQSLHAAAPATVVNIDGKGPSRPYYGIGLVNSSGSSKLLQDYPAAQRREILDLLFKPKFGAGLQLVKNRPNRRGQADCC